MSVPAFFFLVVGRGDWYRLTKGKIKYIWFFLAFLLIGLLKKIEYTLFFPFTSLYISFIDIGRERKDLLTYIIVFRNILAYKAKNFGFNSFRYNNPTIEDTIEGKD